jgi:hypothetical protein
MHRAGAVHVKTSAFSFSGEDPCPCRFSISIVGIEPSRLLLRTIVGISVTSSSL